MAKTETVLSEFRIKDFATQAAFDAAVQAGEIGENDISVTPFVPTNGFNLFDCKWADHILNNISWLRADTFSWQSGDVYVAAYQHLTEEFASVTEWSYETVGGVYIGYKLMPDGHKITDASSEQYVQAIYEATGVAWYYILDTTNRQFKLPRTKWGFTGIRSGVGGYVEAGLPNITGSFTQRRDNNANTVSVSGAFSYSNTGDSGSFFFGDNNTSNGQKISFNASSSNNIYGNSDTVQPQATEMYLYFFVGNYVENATTIDVGKLTEVVNDFDIDTFKPQVDEAKNSAITGISDAKTNAIDSLTNLATDLGTSLKYGNVGDIFYTSRLDVSLNGAVECNGNLYNTTDFSGAQSIGNLLRDNKVPYISLAEHQTTVDTYGSCRCFGWDGGTEFRVPKLADVFIEAGVAASEGEFISAGLPNITGTFKAGSGTYTAKFNNLTGAFGSSATGTGRDVDGGSSTATTIAKFDASKSNSIYGRSTTVQPPAVRYRAMVQLAFGATDDAVVTAGNMVADVSELNSHRVISFQAPTSANGYTWYRKYADGWVEQGVINVEVATSIYRFNFPILMANTNYTVMTSVSDVLNTTNMTAKHYSKATTGVDVRSTYQATSIHGEIMVCGMYAQ